MKEFREFTEFTENTPAPQPSIAVYDSLMAQARDASWFGWLSEEQRAARSVEVGLAEAHHKSICDQIDDLKVAHPELEAELAARTAAAEAESHRYDGWAELIEAAKKS